MKTNNTNHRKMLPNSILSYVKDLPNICSLSGLCCTVLSIYYIILGNYSIAMIGMIWSVVFDWLDGLIARKMKGRTGDDRIFGGQLDLLIDIVSYGVTPAILLLSYGKFDLIYLPGAFIIIAASAIRLSYFSTFGLSDGSKYTGLALDNNNIILVFIFLFEGLFSEEIFSVILYSSCLGLATLNVSQIKTPKFSGNPVNVLVLSIYTIVMTALHGWKFL